MLAFVMAALFGAPQFATGATTPQTIPSIFEDRVLIQATVNVARYGFILIRARMECSSIVTWLSRVD